jgi:glycosyltransferase involved in cell wall biosynthesis
MVDSFSPTHIAMEVVARSLHLPFFIRLRGGMWREVEDRWQLKPFPIKELYSIYYRFCRRQVLSLADGVITVSHFLKNQIICNTDIDFGKVMPVYNPINFAAFDGAREGNFKKKLKIAEDQRVILTVTNFNYYKKYMAIAYYLPAILRALEENSGWRFVIAGDGYSFKRARQSILEEVSESLKKRVVFTGYYKPIEEAFRDCDIVLSLAFRESMGNTVLEAQAAGKPVVVNDFGGSPELLQNWHEKPNCVIKEVSELYESLEMLMDSEELRKSIGQRNRQAVEKKFTAESIGDDFYHVISSLIGERRK